MEIPSQRRRQRDHPGLTSIRAPKTTAGRAHCRHGLPPPRERSPTLARDSLDCGSSGDSVGDQASRHTRPAIRLVSAAAPTLPPMSCFSVVERWTIRGLGRYGYPLSKPQTGKLRCHSLHCVEGVADTDGINIDGDDDDVRNLNDFLIDTAGMAHHLLPGRASRAWEIEQRSNEMITKRFVLATSMMVLLAMSGRAYAGATISDTRYWPSEASSADQSAVQRPENAFASAETPRAIETTGPVYQGGPKGNE